MQQAAALTGSSVHGRRRLATRFSRACARASGVFVLLLLGSLILSLFIGGLPAFRTFGARLPGFRRPGIRCKRSSARRFRSTAR